MTGGKVALVTGCSQGGIGFALCQELAEKGCTVYATARRLGLCEESVQLAVDTVMEREGRIDVLINNAGMSGSGALIDIPIEEIVQTFNTNVFSIVRLTKAVIPHMAARKSGTIVTIGSLAGEIPVPWAGVYAATKAAAHSLTDTLYMECTPLNINVVLVSPGGVKSNISVNQADRDYLAAIMQRLVMSQQNNPMPAAAFAHKYLTLATLSGFYSIMKWLPRGWILRQLWKNLGERPRLKAMQK
ncbi:NAD-P-binding protein [Epithele typhae]|uniref:NAD-P-binding protein n=1 Tax=Epithele typhae TaxID=378194 RepID=UPI0020083AB5|nr:NAD-P-binding protein [Epithele typhae]KAH9913332.1 NAD-P-binding protein [Epithele typhae]